MLVGSLSQTNKNVFTPWYTNLIRSVSSALSVSRMIEQSNGSYSMHFGRTARTCMLLGKDLMNRCIILLSRFFFLS